MTSASMPGRRRWCTWAVVLLGTTACGASAPSSSPVSVWAPSTSAVVIPPAVVGDPVVGDPVVGDAAVATAQVTVPVGPTDAPVSPLAGSVTDLGSALFEPGSQEAAAIPVGISIPELGVAGAPVSSVGVLENGDLDVPDPEVVGWYRYGPTPDDPGSTVLAAHVDFNGVPGVFRYLRDLEVGARIDVQLSDGSSRSYVVTEVRLVDKDDIEAIGVWRRDGAPSLTLVTCGGRFDDDRRRYEDNVVAFATPA